MLHHVKPSILSSGHCHGNLTESWYFSFFGIFCLLVTCQIYQAYSMTAANNKYPLWARTIWVYSPAMSVIFCRFNVMILLLPAVRAYNTEQHFTRLWLQSSGYSCRLNIWYIWKFLHCQVQIGLGGLCLLKDYHGCRSLSTCSDSLLTLSTPTS